MSLALVIAACGGDAPGPDPTGPGDVVISPSVRFAQPLVGELRSHLFYGAYFDQQAGPTAGDYNCGLKAYDEHRGVDILLRNFTVQDSGVTVIAAAKGTVTATRDGQFDRSTANGSGGFGNYVALLHEDGTVSIYGHLRAGSIPVTVGQEVAVGAPLGLVGSSGNSNWPHLHFEVQRASLAVDPFNGPCGAGASLWQSQIAYQDTFMVTDADVVVQDALSFAQLLERPAATDSVGLDATYLWIWVELFNVRSGVAQFDFYGPDSALARSFSNSVSRTYSMRYVTLRVAVAEVFGAGGPGTWRVEYRQDGARAWGRTFAVRPAAALAVRRWRLPEPDGKFVIWDVPPGDGVGRSARD